MQLRITTPTKLLLERQVTAVQAEDASGRFGILPGHEPMLTALVPSILVFRYEDNGGGEGYAALREGILRVTGDGVQVAARDAHLSDDLAGLQEEIRSALRRRTQRSYRSVRSFYQLQLAAWRRLAEFEDAPRRSG